MKILRRLRLFGAMMLMCLGASMLLATPAEARREIVVTSTGQAPVNRCGTPVNQLEGAIRVLRLSEADAASLREQVAAGGGVEITRASGHEFDYYTGCRNGRVVNVGGSGDVVVYRGSEPLGARQYVLPSGRRVERIHSCGNWASGGHTPPPPPPVRQVPPPPPLPCPDIPLVASCHRPRWWTLERILQQHSRECGGWCSDRVGSDDARPRSLTGGVLYVRVATEKSVSALRPAAVYGGEPGNGRFRGHLSAAAFF